MSGYKIVRTRSAGVFAGYLVERRGSEVDMREARRLWYWAGAATLSELAVRGPSRPDLCRFPAPVSVTLLGVIEVIDVTEQAQGSIVNVKEWTAHA